MDAEKIYKELTEIRISQTRMEADLEQHIKRTEILETAIVPLSNTYNIAKWAIAFLLGFISVVGTILKLYDILHR